MYKEKKKVYSDKILCPQINYHYTANNLTPWENLKRHQIHIFFSFFSPRFFFLYFFIVHVLIPWKETRDYIFKYAILVNNGTIFL